MANLNAGLVACGFSGNPDQYCYEILYFCAFSGGADPLPPSLDPHMQAMHVSVW